MYCCMTSRRPTSSHTNKGGVVGQADIKEFLANGGWPWSLGMTFQAEVGVSLDQQLGIDRTMWLVADGAAFSHRSVFEYHRTALLGMTTSTCLVHPGHRQSTGGFQDVTAMRIMTFNAIHLLFRDWVMLREAELRLGGSMTLKTGRRILAGVEYEFPSAPAARRVEAARPVTGLAPGLATTVLAFEVNPSVSARRELPDDIGVAFKAALIAHERSSRNGGSGGENRRRSGAGIQQQERREDEARPAPNDAPRFHVGLLVTDSALRISETMDSDKSPPTGNVIWSFPEGLMISVRKLCS